ncbi:X8 domain-containing protein [Psidium guajava]|nr:X8 domain-containing protein [Psidium guajava]
MVSNLGIPRPLKEVNPKESKSDVVGAPTKLPTPRRTRQLGHQATAIGHCPARSVGGATAAWPGLAWRGMGGLLRLTWQQLKKLERREGKWV